MICSYQAMPNDAIFKVSIVEADMTAVGLILNASALDTTTSLTTDSSVFAAYFSNDLRELAMFESNIKKSDRGHLTRLRDALTAAMNDLVDSRGQTLRPVTDVKILEDNRLVMVYATVMNQLLQDYEDIEAIKPIVSTLEKIAGQIRKDYGWGDDGLAGSASKSFAALSTVIDLELGDLYRMSAEFSQSPGAISTLIRANSKIISTDRGASAGDVAAKAKVQDFNTAWNSPDWQAMLTQLINAPVDYQGEVQPKLRLLLTAVESMSDLSGLDFTIAADVLARTAPKSTSTAPAKR
jgi:ribosome-binding factor A